MERLLVETERMHRGGLDRQWLLLIFHGASLRSAEACLEAAFGKEALSKSAIAERIVEACEAAEELFQEYFAGRGTAAACDEIYLSGHPCLDVVEPYSPAFTGIRPNTEPTREAWDVLLEGFSELESAVSDQGKGVSQALAGRVPRFALDVWHLLPKGWSEFSREEMRRLTCLAWRHHHRRETHLLEAPREAAAWVARQMGAPFAARHLEAYCREVFRALDLTLRASSAVECLNSVIRLREGAKRHANPGFVYPMAWLHNTRRFTEGRRKGLTPAEILDVPLPTDGLPLLLSRVAIRRKAREAKRTAV